MKPKKTKEQFLLDRLEKTGLPLEMEVSIVLEKKGWLVFNQEPYVDFEEGKTREIDIFAMHPSEIVHHVLNKKTIFPLDFDISIECKKSDNTAWVFLTRPATKLGFWRTATSFGNGQHVDFLSVLTDHRISFVDEHVTMPRIHYSDYRRVSHIGTEVKVTREEDEESSKGPDKKREEIFGARNQLMKYSIDVMKTEKEAMAEDMSRDTAIKPILFLFLVIVFDGMLYEAFVRKNKLTIRSSPRILLRSGKVLGPEKVPREYLIDVVQKQHFSSYVDTITADVARIRKMFKSKKQNLLSQADEEIEAFSKYRQVLQTK